MVESILKQTLKDLIKIGYIILLIILVIMIFRRIFYGGSDALIIGLILANLGYSWYINNQLQRHMGEHEGYKKGLEDGLSKRKG